ncbi:MAG: hypothetical protein KME04_12845 [Pleurocapsa minor GSE-CHR-MK-17-07R]|jgi:hypothetical protein|nr:hypothetical protein [Pleurocapsa minor GSE-CHR-MK 17-07R]
MNVSFDNRQHMKQHALRQAELERVVRSARLAKEATARSTRRSPLASLVRLVAMFL